MAVVKISFESLKVESLKFESGYSYNLKYFVLVSNIG
jgi:hypothetical protein